MEKILKLNAISSVAEKALDGAYQLTDKCDKPVAIMLRSFDMHGYALPESALAVARAGAGVNNIPVNEYADKGVVVFNTPGANANAVKELTVLALLLSARNAADGITWAKTLTGDDVAKQVEAGKKKFVGHELIGKTLGVIGLGAIGVLVANVCVHLGMRVLGYDPFLSVENALNLNHHIKRTENLDEVFSESDFITLHVPFSDATRSTINKNALAKMRDGVNIINLARGELCDESAVIAALKNGKVHRYVTDFATPALLAENGVTVMPHLGASTEEAEDNCAVMASMELVDYLKNGNVKNSVNFPSCSLAKSATHRIAVAHRNVKRVIGTVADVFSENNINIENFVSQSKGDYAYALIDVNDSVTPAILDKIRKLENILRVREVY